MRRTTRLARLGEHMLGVSYLAATFYAIDILMKHICPQCTEVIINYGLPCAQLLDAVSTHMFKGNLVAYDVCHCERSKYITRALRYLENKGLLLSTEIGESSIAIQAHNYYLDEYTAELCWCKLFAKTGELND